MPFFWEDIMDSLESPSKLLPSLVQNMTCIWQNVTGMFWGFSNRSVKTSWKCVAARTLGHWGPLSSRCLRTPQNKPAPSGNQNSIQIGKRCLVSTLCSHLLTKSLSRTHRGESMSDSYNFEETKKLGSDLSWTQTGPGVIRVSQKFQSFVCPWDLGNGFASWNSSKD